MSELEQATQFAACMAYDAFRLCMGHKPRRFKRAQVIRWLQLMAGKGGDK